MPEHIFRTRSNIQLAVNDLPDTCSDLAEIFIFADDAKIVQTCQIS